MAGDYPHESQQRETKRARARAFRYRSKANVIALARGTVPNKGRGTYPNGIEGQVRLSYPKLCKALQSRAKTKKRRSERR